MMSSAMRMMSTVRTAVLGAPPPSDTTAAIARPRRLVAASARAKANGTWEAVVESVPVAGRARVPCVLGPFATEAEANAACRHDAPPLWDEAQACARCSVGFGLMRRRHHCRNCGYSMCDACTTKWPAKSLPPLYTENEAGGSERSLLRSLRQFRVCLSCDAAAQDLRTALLRSDVQAVRRAYADGGANVNLRCHLPPAGEGQQAQLLPVHLAAAANSLPTLRWLCEAECCPLLGKEAMSIGASGANLGARVQAPKSVLQVALEAQVESTGRTDRVSGSPAGPTPAPMRKRVQRFHRLRVGGLLPLRRLLSRLCSPTRPAGRGGAAVAHRCRGCTSTRARRADGHARR